MDEEATALRTQRVEDGRDMEWCYRTAQEVCEKFEGRAENEGSKG